MTPTTIPEEELYSRAIEVLRREIGLVNTLRFITQLKPGTGDYTKERDVINGDMTVDEIMEAIKQRRKTNSREKTRDTVATGAEVTT